MQDALDCRTGEPRAAQGGTHECRSFAGNVGAQGKVPAHAAGPAPCRAVLAREVKILTMAAPRSRLAFPTTIRRLVALALAPVASGAYLACGGSAVPTSTYDARGDDATTGMPNPGHLDDGGADADAPNQVCPCGRGCYTCKVTFDGGSGACAAQQVSGSPCDGMQVLYPCGLPAPVATDASVANPLCAQYCGTNYYLCDIVQPDGGYVSLFSVDAAAPYVGDGDGGARPTTVACVLDCTGRLPESLLDEVRADTATLGESLAHAAYLEAAAVRAFLDLATQLKALGAPPSLVRRARRASRDEVRHARVMEKLARAHGGPVRPPRTAPTEVTDPFTMALLNAREGCVRETWGAACAVVQAHKATDPGLRRVMKAIARDEITHAALSRDVAAWLEPQLTKTQRAAVNAERRRAIVEIEADLRSEENADPRADLRGALGLPSKREARTLFAAMRAEGVWAEAA